MKFLTILLFTILIFVVVVVESHGSHHHHHGKSGKNGVNGGGKQPENSHQSHLHNHESHFDNQHQQHQHHHQNHHQNHHHQHDNLLVFDSNLMHAFGLTFLGAISNSVGALLPYLSPLFPRTFESPMFLSGALSFASGVMIYASFVELMPEAKESFAAEVGHKWASLWVLVSFVIGWIGIEILDWIIDTVFQGDTSNCCNNDKDRIRKRQSGLKNNSENSSNRDNKKRTSEKEVITDNRIKKSTRTRRRKTTSIPEEDGNGNENENENDFNFSANVGFYSENNNNPKDNHHEKESKKIPVEMANHLKRVGWQTALALCVHNVPEGVITFVTCMSNVRFGLFVGIAVIIHNIPEGLSVSLPIYYATGSKWQGFLYGGLFSGLAEPFGALLAYLVISYNVDLSLFTWNNGAWDKSLNPLPPLLSGLVYCMTAGTMANVVFKGLLPVSRKLDPKDITVSRSILTGLCLMMFSVHLLDISFS